MLLHSVLLLFLKCYMALMPKKHYNINQSRFSHSNTCTCVIFRSVHISIHHIVVGNLALSRALGDFVFKKNDKKKAEEQIVTGQYNSLLN